MNPDECPGRSYRLPVFRGLEPFPKSGRQDLNLRPPGPQPERSGFVRRRSAHKSHVSDAELPSVVLSLIPGLRPVGLTRDEPPRSPPDVRRSAAGVRTEGKHSRRSQTRGIDPVAVGRPLFSRSHPCRSSRHRRCSRRWAKARASTCSSPVRATSGGGCAWSRRASRRDAELEAVRRVGASSLIGDTPVLKQHRGGLTTAVL